MKKISYSRQAYNQILKALTLSKEIVANLQQKIHSGTTLEHPCINREKMLNRQILNCQQTERRLEKLYQQAWAEVQHSNEEHNKLRQQLKSLLQEIQLLERSSPHSYRTNFSLDPPQSHAYHQPQQRF